MKRFEIYPVDLNPTIGTEMNKTRPCVIISPDEMNDSLKTVIIAPLTSVERNLPTRIFVKASKMNGLKNDSYIVLDQIKTVDKLRLYKNPKLKPAKNKSKILRKTKTRFADLAGMQ